jgi:hypothetical protein
MRVTIVLHIYIRRRSCAVRVCYLAYLDDENFA